MGVMLAGMIVYCVCKMVYSSVKYEELPPTLGIFTVQGWGSGSTSDMFPYKIHKDSQVACINRLARSLFTQGPGSPADKGPYQLE